MAPALLSTLTSSSRTHTQDAGARIKELKRRWPNVFVYVEKDNTLTVRGSVQEEVDACFYLALFFKDKPKTWEVESWCRCGRCCTEDGCTVPRPSKSAVATAETSLPDLDGDMIEYIVKILKSRNGVVLARLLAKDININKKDCLWPAVLIRSGGFKKFCLHHADKIKWVEISGGGKALVELVETDVILPTPSPESAACGSCNACTFKTKNPGTKCNLGSKCRQKTCLFAHASPSGDSRMAGDEPTSCRYGMQCNNPTCKFAHPSKVWKSREQDSDGDVIDYIVLKVKRSKNGVLPYLLLFNYINKTECSWSAAIRRAGGFRNLCLKHAGQITWVKDPVSGEANVEIVKTDAIPATPSLESAACGSCNACTSCPEGILCNEPKCQFAHPNKVFKSTAQDSDGDVIKYIMESLKESPTGHIMAYLLGSEIKKRDCWWSAVIKRAGGFKNFCLKHAGKIRWVDQVDGGANVSLVKGDVATAVVERDVGTIVEREQNSRAALMLKTKGANSVVSTEDLAVAGGGNAVLIPPTPSIKSENPSNSTKLSAEATADIVPDGVAAGGGNAVLIPPNPSRESVKPPNGSELSAEATNFVRYSRLMTVGKEVMASIFRASYQTEFKKPWAQSSGDSFLHHKFPDGSNILRQLDPQYIDKIKAGKIEEWDVSLLSRLLLSVPGYLKETKAKNAVETLRRERNILAHDFLAKQSLSEKEFKDKWDIASGALNILTNQLSPAEKNEIELKIGEIVNAQMRESDLERLRKSEKMHEDIKCIQEKIEKVPTMSEVKLVVENFFEDRIFESALNQKGQVDLKTRPRDINGKRYQLIKRVGNGGMGTVFEGKLIGSASDANTVALKFCHANECSARAQQEVDILQKLKQLNHDNIVKFIDGALCGSLRQWVIVMEFVQGLPLDDWLEMPHNGGNRDIFLKAQNIIKQLVTGMSVVHSHGIVHRDIKPGNLIFNESTDKLVIVDFGLSKQHNTNPTITGANDQLGTPLYMSPESIDREEVVSFPSDVWSIGIVWHELLTSFTPFEPFDAALGSESSGPLPKRRILRIKQKRDMESAICEKQHARPRKLPLLDQMAMPAATAVHVIIAKCLNVCKKERYSDAQELLTVFKGLEGEIAEQEREIEEQEFLTMMNSLVSCSPGY